MLPTTTGQEGRTEKEWGEGVCVCGGGKGDCGGGGGGRTKVTLCFTPSQTGQLHQGKCIYLCDNNLTQLVLAVTNNGPTWPALIE